VPGVRKLEETNGPCFYHARSLSQIGDGFLDSRAGSAQILKIFDVSLILYQSNRLEVLAQKLARETLRAPLASVFATEQIIVPAQGLAQWLKLELARLHGLAANLQLPFPRAFFSGLMQKLLPAEKRAGLIEPEALAWRLMEKIEPLLDRPAFAEIKNYLANSADPRRKFQLAERVAALFDQYSVYRPEWIDAWQNRRQEKHWQAELWRAAMGEKFACQGRFLHELLLALRNPDCDKSKLPERLAIFCPASLPPVYLEVFQSLARHIPVHLFWLSPCAEYWGDITSALEDEAIRTKTAKGKLSPRELHLDRGHPLLAAWGKTGREFQRLVADLQMVDQQVEEFFEPPPKNLLSRVQRAILKLDDFPAGEKIEIARDDRSIQIHNCHSPLRELEVLRDHLLAWFGADATLTPADVLVMLPDVAAYAPFIKGVFDRAEAGAPAIPFTLADQSARQESSPVNAFASLLQLAPSRHTATAVMDFFETPAVRRRFSISEDELPQLREWLRSAGIRWGRDAAHRAQLGLPEFAEHTWEHGNRRLLLGYAMADDGDTTFAGLLPCAGIEGTAAELLGRWLDFQEQLFSALDEFAEARTLTGWAEVLNGVLDKLFLPEPAEEFSANTVRKVFHELRQQQTISGFSEKIPFAVVLERILPKLDTEPDGKAVLRGRVTFAGLNPLRNVPFRAVCVLGMDDAGFPRRPAPLSFDLMAAQPRTGDASRRDDDRWLFLETLLAAREKFYISYVGQSVADNSPRPPSVVVSELLDYLGSRFCLAETLPEKTSGEPRIVNELLVTRHRLHGFNPKYFSPEKSGDARLFGFSEAAAEISRHIAGRAPRGSAAPLISAPLAAPDAEWKTVSLRDLQYFFQNPAKFFVKRRLEFRLPDDGELLADEELFSVGGLDAYQLKQEILDAFFERRPVEKLLAAWQAGGRLPVGSVGALAANDLLAATKPLVEKLRQRVGTAKKIRRQINLQLGDFRLEGELAMFPNAGLVHCRPAKAKPAAHLNLWIEHLALQLAGISEIKTSRLIAEDGIWIFNAVPDAEKILHGLLETYFLGLTKPLPFFPASAFAIVSEPSSRSKKSPADLALEKWDGGEFDDFSKGESQEPYFNLCFRNTTNPLDEEFETLATQIVKPLLAHQTEEVEP
jgi:exodeoxyribonuclease V gamma subunit